jgi:hypothetical protein
MVNKSNSVRNTMLTNLISKASKLGDNKLNGAVILSVAAMLSFNIVVLASQLQSAPQFARSAGATAGQA